MIVSGSNSPLYYVVIRKTGPMQIKLLLHSSRKFATVNGFDRTNGEMGEAESSGDIKIGDALIAINRISLISKSFEDVLGIIRSESSKTTVRELTFCKKRFINHLIYDKIDINQYFKNGIVIIEKLDQNLPNIEMSYDELVQAVISDLCSNVDLEDKHDIDEDMLIQLAITGIPDYCLNIRSIAWKVLLR
jgi:hypothetical protein